MKEKQIVKLKALIVVIIALGAIVIFPNDSRAVVTCPTTSTADSDGDGFTDAQECTGIILNLTQQGVPQVTFPTCTTGAVRSSCMDPNTKDVFVILVRAAGSLIPTEPYKYITAPQSTTGGLGGLGITVHEISELQVAADRKVTSVSLQKAARLQESRDTSDPNVLGSSNQGIALDFATTFTQRIVDKINSVCIAGTTCVDFNFPTTINTALLVSQEYIRHDIAHELGHSLNLAPDYIASLGGNHDPAGQNIVMEQNATYQKKGTKVTWYLSFQYPATQQAAARLQ
jgi:hypothetical protein